jgi:hypothetical protein
MIALMAAIENWQNHLQGSRIACQVKLKSKQIFKKAYLS